MKSFRYISTQDAGQSGHAASEPVCGPPWKQTPTGAIRTDKHQTILLTWYGPDILRVRIWPGDCLPLKASLCVVAEPSAPEGWELDQQGDAVVLSGPSLCARIGSTGDITFLRRGRELLTAKGDGVAFPGNSLPDPADRLGAEQVFSLDPEHALYGLGQFQNGVLNWRGHDATLIHGNTTVVVPFLCSSGNWGLLWDNASHTEFSDGPDGMRLWSEVGDGVDFYVCSGENLDAVIAGYRRLTGDPPLFPRGFYGYIQCKCRYMSATELVDVVAEHRQRKLPLDVIVQDWLYWGRWKETERWSSMLHDEASYGDLPGAIRKIHDLHALVMVSIWPCLGVETAICRELMQKGFVFDDPSTPTRKVFDAFSPAARAIYWRHANEGLFAHGVDAWWMDATEPEFRGCHDPLKHKQSLASQRATAAGSWSRVLNGYSLAATTGVYEGQRAASEDKRVFILSRSAWAGQQRNAAATWSGDTTASWETFKKQIPAGLNFCLAGMPYWTTDNGGFFLRGGGSSFPEGVDDPAFREFFLRWFQYSCFCPLMRSHGTDTPREIWQFGRPGDMIYDTLAAFDNLRMRLLPYSYSLAAEACFRGSTPMRALAMDYGDDPLTYDIKYQFHYGPALMACPVVEPMRFLPKGGSDVLFAPGHFKGGARIRNYDGLEGLAVAKECIHEGGLDFNWSGNLPDGVTSDVYRIEISGELEPDRLAGQTELLVQFAGRCRVEVDDEQVLDDWVDGPLRKRTVPLPRPRAGLLRLKVIYGHTGGAPVLKIAKEVRIESPQEQPARPFTREVYLPQGVWHDFWTGEAVRGGRTVTCQAPLERIPVLAPAGALLPLGPVQQWHDELPQDRLELRIYPGADGRFTFYQDAGNSYAYEHGERSTFDLVWDDAEHRLTIGDRQGAYPGMPKTMAIDVVLVSTGHGVGIDAAVNPNLRITYTGAQVSATVH